MLGDTRGKRRGWAGAAFGVVGALRVANGK